MHAHMRSGGDVAWRRITRCNPSQAHAPETALVKHSHGSGERGGICRQIQNLLHLGISVASIFGGTLRR